MLKNLCLCSGEKYCDMVVAASIATAHPTTIRRLIPQVNLKPRFSESRHTYYPNECRHDPPSPPKLARKKLPHTYNYRRLKPLMPSCSYYTSSGTTSRSSNNNRYSNRVSAPNAADSNYIELSNSYSSKSGSKNELYPNHSAPPPPNNDEYDYISNLVCFSSSFSPNYTSSTITTTTTTTNSIHFYHPKSIQHNFADYTSKSSSASNDKAASSSVYLKTPSQTTWSNETGKKNNNTNNTAETFWIEPDHLRATMAKISKKKPTLPSTRPPNLKLNKIKIPLLTNNGPSTSDEAIAQQQQQQPQRLNSKPPTIFSIKKKSKTSTATTTTTPGYNANVYESISSAKNNNRLSGAAQQTNKLDTTANTAVKVECSNLSSSGYDYFEMTKCVVMNKSGGGKSSTMSSFSSRGGGGVDLSLTSQTSSVEAIANVMETCDLSGQEIAYLAQSEIDSLKNSPTPPPSGTDSTVRCFPSRNRDKTANKCRSNFTSYDLAKPRPDCGAVDLGLVTRSCHKCSRRKKHACQCGGVKAQKNRSNVKEDLPNVKKKDVCRNAYYDLFKLENQNLKPNSTTKYKYNIQNCKCRFIFLFFLLLIFLILKANFEYTNIFYVNIYCENFFNLYFIL